MSPATASLRVTPNPWHALGGIWRLTYRRFLSPVQLLTLAGILALLAFFLFTVFQRTDTKFYTQWTVQFYLAFLVPILAFLSGAGAMRDEMKPESIDYVLTRPVRRPAIVLFKFLSHVACIQIGFMLALAVVIAAGVYRQIPTVMDALPWLVLAQVCAVTAFAAFGFLSAVLTARYLVIGLVYAGIIEFAIGNLPTTLSRLSMTRQLRTLLHPVLSTIDPKLVADQGALTTVAVLAGFAVVMLGVAAMVFSRLEMAGARPSEN